MNNSFKLENDEESVIVVEKTSKLNKGKKREAIDSEKPKNKKLRSASTWHHFDKNFPTTETFFISDSGRPKDPSKKKVIFTFSITDQVKATVDKACHYIFKESGLRIKRKMDAQYAILIDAVSVYNFIKIMKNTPKEMRHSLEVPEMCQNQIKRGDTSVSLFGMDLNFSNKIKMAKKYFRNHTGAVLDNIDECLDRIGILLKEEIESI